ncbi:MAG: YebC/PmpR family DNA-binding transcriptional regulator [Candidatus Sungiibacteriota bacterium]
MSGHSKWSQIKHKKGTADAKRGQVFSKLVKEITIAAREAGANPDANPRLRAACERARAEGLPKDNMDRAIARAAGKGEGAELFEFLYEATSPGGIALLIEGITDNKNRSVNEIKYLLGEHGARLAEPGSIIWNFEKIGVIICASMPDASQEVNEFAIIESGARDFTMDGNEGVWLIETSFNAREGAADALKQSGFTIRETRYVFKSKSPITPDAAIAPKIEALLDALIEHDDVQEIYTNITRN